MTSIVENFNIQISSGKRTVEIMDHSNAMHLTVILNIRKTSSLIVGCAYEPLLSDIDDEI
jgi:hypothetical protein